MSVPQLPVDPAGPPWSPEIIILESPEDLADTAARLIASAAGAAVEANGQFVWALSGGSTPRPIYHALASGRLRELFPWSDAHFYWADEREVAADDPESNHRAAQEAMLTRVPVAAEHVHRIRGELGNERAAELYEQELRQLRDARAPLPMFDLVLLGLGADGHTASLFPGARAVAEALVVTASAEYGGRPSRRISLTPWALSQCQQAFFVVAGAEKAAAVRGTLAAAGSPERWPAQRVRPVTGRVTWFLDSASAQLLAPRS
jgi:6-phosphogluconolactonase